MGLSFNQMFGSCITNMLQQHLVVYFVKVDQGNHEFYKKSPRGCLLLLAFSVRDSVNYIKHYHDHCPSGEKAKGKYKEPKSKNSVGIHNINKSK